MYTESAFAFTPAAIFNDAQTGRGHHRGLHDSAPREHSPRTRIRGPIGGPFSARIAQIAPLAPHG